MRKAFENRDLHILDQQDPQWTAELAQLLLDKLPCKTVP
jgi:hypothetical protein